MLLPISAAGLEAWYTLH